MRGRGRRWKGGGEGEEEVEGGGGRGGGGGRRRRRRKRRGGLEKGWRRKGGGRGGRVEEGEEEEASCSHYCSLQSVKIQCAHTVCVCVYFCTHVCMNCMHCRMCECTCIPYYKYVQVLKCVYMGTCVSVSYAYCMYVCMFIPFLHQLLESQGVVPHHYIRFLKAELHRVVPSPKWVVETGLI